jgi:tRNA threonylcarbamoyladenosine biosynthesis protein TsaB
LIVLGIETATRVTAVGIVRDGQAIVDVSETATTGHAARLPDIVAQALREAGIGFEGVEGLGVSVGPGSFTGLRVGLSFAKGVAFSGGCPLVGVGTPDALATLAPEKYGRVATVLDARRGETYVAFFRREGRLVGRSGIDLALGPEEACDRICEEAAAEGGAPMIVLGDGIERYASAFSSLAARGIDAAPLAEIAPRGSSVALLAAARLRRGERDRPESVVPRYVRASAAERNAVDTSLTREKALS